MNKCDNCGKEILGVSIVSPTTNIKRKQQCKDCAMEWIKSKKSKQITQEYLDDNNILADVEDIYE